MSTVKTADWKFNIWWVQRKMLIESFTENKFNDKANILW